MNIDWDNANNYIDKDGYWTLYVFIDNKKYTKKVHRYIYELHNGIIPKGYDIHHIDGNKRNNNISNLQCIKHNEHFKLHHNLVKPIKYPRRKKVKKNIEIKTNISIKKLPRKLIVKKPKKIYSPVSYEKCRFIFKDNVFFQKCPKCKIIKNYNDNFNNYMPVCKECELSLNVKIA
ncbi:MAG: HNH endonuclease signature motif containing protein [Legionellales bacterium]|jgi:hypothetical protein